MLDLGAAEGLADVVDVGVAEGIVELVLDLEARAKGLADVPAVMKETLMFVSDGLAQIMKVAPVLVLPEMCIIPVEHDDEIE